MGKTHKSGQTLFLTFWRGWDWSQVLNTLNWIGRGTSLTACFQLSVQFAVFLTVLWTMPCSSIDNHMLYVVQAQPVWRLCLLQFTTCKHRRWNNLLPASIEGENRSIAQKHVELQALIHNSIWTQIQIPHNILLSPPKKKKKKKKKSGLSKLPPCIVAQSLTRFRKWWAAKFLDIFKLDLRLVGNTRVNHCLHVIQLSQIKACCVLSST